MSENASLKIWQTLQPMVRKEVAKGTESSVKSKKMVVTTAYNTSTKTVGVTEAFGKEIQVPVAGMINPDRLRVGTSVWVIALHGSWSNAIVCMLGDGQIPPANFAPRNLLDNSDFTNPVNQRCGTSYNSTSVCIDRWKVLSGTFVVNSGYISTGFVEQRILIGTMTGVHTLAAKRRDGTILVYSQEITNSYSYTEARPAFGAWDELVRITLPAGEYVWAALYEGEYTADTLPPYVPKGYAVELAACQYFETVIEVPVNSRMGVIRAGSANGILLLNIPTMRKDVALSYSVISGNVTDLLLDNTQISASDISAYGAAVGNTANALLTFSESNINPNVLDTVRNAGNVTFKLLVSAAI